jgi:hypothetical protein
MRFLVHGPVHPEAQAALEKHRHTCHALLELSADTDAPDQTADNPPLLLPILEKHQWNLLTADGDFVRRLFDLKVLFRGLIVHILDDPDLLHDQGRAIDRLFERYPRLTPRRLYTITPSRVKIRQLPGGHVSG